MVTIQEVEKELWSINQVGSSMKTFYNIKRIQTDWILGITSLVILWLMGNKNKYGPLVRLL